MQAKLHQRRLAAGPLLRLRLAPFPALRGDAAHLLDVDRVIAVIAQVETVDVPIRHIHRADALGRLRFAVFVLVVVLRSAA